MEENIKEEPKVIPITRKKEFTEEENDRITKLVLKHTKSF